MKNTVLGLDINLFLGITSIILSVVYLISSIGFFISYNDIIYSILYFGYFIGFVYFSFKFMVEYYKDKTRHDN